MHVQWPTFLRQAKNQTARTILIVRIIFNNFAAFYGFTHFLNADATQNALVNRVFRELELAVHNLEANLIYHILRTLFYVVIDRIPFHGLEASAVDHFDDLLLGHFDFAAGLDGVAVGEFAAVGDGAVEVARAEVGI